MATYYWVGGSGTWDNSSTTNWASSSGGAGGAGVPTNADDAVFDSNSGTAATVTVAATAVSLNTTIDKSDINLSLSGSPTLCTIAGTLTLTSGTITLNGNTLSTGIFSSSNTNARTIAFGTGNIALTSTTASTTVLAMATATNFTMTTSGGGFTRNQSAAAIVNFGATAGGTVSNAPNLTVNAGAAVLTIQPNSWFKNLVFTGSSCLVQNSVNVAGNLTNSATGTYTSLSPTFRASGTITTSGKGFGNAVTIDGSGITVTLADALIISGGPASNLVITRGTFNTANFNVTAGSLSSNNSNTRTITLGSSTLTLNSPVNQLVVDFSTPTNLTFNANTSQINCSAATHIFGGGGQTFYNVSFTNSASAGGITISGANTFNNLSFTTRALTSINAITLSSNQTVSGTLTFGAANTAIRRWFVRSSTIGTQRTITLNGTLATLADVDFRDIVTAGSAGTWTGTRIGDCKGNSGITFTAAKTVYWNLAGTNSWAATGWATTNTGTPAVNNFPLAQDTATFTEAGAAGTVTIATNWNIGTIQMADGVSNRTTAFTLASGTTAPTIYGNVTLFSSLTLTGTGTWTFAGQGTTQTITSAGRTFTQRFTIDSPSGTFQLGDDVTVSNTTTPGVTLTSGTLNLSSGNRTLSCLSFSSDNSNTRAISFGSGSIALTSTTAGTTVLNMATATGFTWTGTGSFTRNMAATATVNFGTTAGGTASNAPNLTVNAGSSALTIATGTNFSYFKDLIFTGSTSAVSGSYNAAGNLTLATGGTYTSLAVNTIDTATITSNGKTLGNVSINSTGKTVTLADDMTLGAANTLTLQNGTFNASNQNVSTGLFRSSNSNTRTLTMGSGSWTITGTGSVWDIADPTNLTLNKNTANITLSNTSTSARTFAGGGQTYNDLTIGGTTGTSTLTFTGSSTFGTIASTKTVAHTIRFAPGTTTTVSGWTVTGSAGNVVTINSSTPGSQFTLSDAAGSVTTNFMNITDSNATGGARWTALSSINGGNNSGWLFGAYNISGDSELLFFP